MDLGMLEAYVSGKQQAEQVKASLEPFCNMGLWPGAIPGLIHWLSW